MRLKPDSEEKEAKSFLNVSGSSEKWRENFGNTIQSRARNPNSPITGGDTSNNRGSFREGLGDRRGQKGFMSRILDAIGAKLREWVSEGAPEDENRITDIQTQLQEAGLYDGPIDGVKNQDLMALIREMGIG